MTERADIESAPTANSVGEGLDPPLPCLFQVPAMILLARERPRPPCVKGAGTLTKRDWGIAVEMDMVFCNPSVKNHGFLTAPLTQGSLGRSRASAVNDHL